MIYLFPSSGNSNDNNENLGATIFLSLPFFAILIYCLIEFINNYCIMENIQVQDVENVQKINPIQNNEENKNENTDLVYPIRSSLSSK